MIKTLYNKDNTRLSLVKSIPESNNNFLFLPGGPGVDSHSLMGCVDSMNLPGNYWLVDLVFNGTNDQHEWSDDSIFSQWPLFLKNAVTEFENPILIGHSFGGFLPFFSEGLEDHLKALIILNSCPNLTSPIFAETAKVNHLPSLSPEKDAFIESPTLQNMKALYEKEVFYFFSKESQQKGLKTIIQKLRFCLRTEHWWYTKGFSQFLSAKFIPSKTPTLLIGGSDDLITPISVFMEDARFSRPNIKTSEIKGCGHFPWLEKPAELEAEISQFMTNFNNT